MTLNIIMWTDQIEFLRRKHEECQELRTDLYLISDRIGCGAKKIMYLSIAIWNILSQGRVESQAPQFSSFIFLFIFCVFLLTMGGGGSSHYRIFHSYGDVTITGEGLQSLTYMCTRHSWSLNSKGSLMCHTYTGHSFIMVISEDPCHSHLLPSV